MLTVNLANDVRTSITTTFKRIINDNRQYFIMKVNNTGFYSGSAPIIGNSLIHLEFLLLYSHSRSDEPVSTEFLQCKYSRIQKRVSLKNNTLSLSRIQIHS